MKRILSVIMAALILFAAFPSTARANETVPQESTTETSMEETTESAEEVDVPTEETAVPSLEAEEPTEENVSVFAEEIPPICETERIVSTLNYGEILVDGTDDSFEKPHTIRNGQTLTGTVDTTVRFIDGVGASADQNDYYRFSLSIRSNVTIRVSSNYPLYSVVLWDGNGFNIANGTVITKQLSAGTYTVSIQNRPKTGTNGYTISLSYCDHAAADITEIESPTCTETGAVLYDCPSCYETWTQSTPAKGHNYGSWTVVSNPTCTENGTKAKYCARCNDQATAPIPPTGHDLGAWMETRPATCEKEGLSSAWCSVCGEEEVSKTPALGHEYGDWEITREPTCSLEGVNAKTCIRCSAKISESIPVVEHTFGEWVVTKKATCKTEGSRIRFCPVCGISETEVFTSPHNDKFQELTKLKDNGWAVYTFRCYDCGTTSQDEAPCIFTYGSYSYGSIAEGTTRIGDSAFEGTNLESIHIPDSVTSIGKAAFKNTKLTSITIPKGVTEIQEETFAYCYNLSKVTFPAVFLRNYGPEGVTSIGQRAFASCRNLTSIVLPQRLETVGKEAFSGTGLRKIVLPQSVTSLGSRAFPDTLQKITFSGRAPKYPSYNRPYDQPFGNCTADAYYPAGKWSSSAQDGVGMNLNWIACEHPNKTPSSCTFPYICNDCGAMGYYRASHTATDATCTEPSVCTTCENIVGNALGHVFEDYVANNDRSCTANGTETAKCTRCDATHTRDIPGTLLGHSFGDHVPNGDGKCYVDGTKTAKCRRCDAVNIVTDPGSITEHSIVIVEGKAPTCLEMGLTDGEYCSICGAVTEVQYPIRTSDHSYTDDKDTTCNVCGETRELSVPMHRMYDPNSGEHFYTGAEAERDFLVEAGWHYEGVGFNFPVEGAPVHRLYDPVHGEHLYTMNKQEMNKLLDKGWQYEGVAFNSAGNDEVPQYRLHNPNAKRGGYHFTGSTEERDLLISFGWINQGIGWYSCLE